MSHDGSRPALGRLAARGVATTSIGQIARLLLQVASIVILARMLPASDFGLVAMVTAIVGVAELFRDFGLSHAAVQARTISDREASNLFWINSGIGIALAAATVSCSWLIAGLYDEPRLVVIAQVLASTFVLNGIATQFRANLNREMKLGRLAVIDSGSIALALATGIGVAALGGGFWALVAQNVASAAIALVALLGVSRWRPGWYDRSVSVRRLLSFGSYLLLAQIVTYASRNIDSVIVGVRFGASQLGFYDRAYQLMTYPLNQINAPSTRVALPVLSRLQDDRTSFNRYLLTGQALILHGSLFVFGYAAAVADTLIPFVLGEQWIPSAPLFRIFAVAGIFSLAGNVAYWVFLATGKTRQQLWYALTMRPLVIGGIVIGAFWGVEGVAIAFAIGNFVLWPAGLVWISKACGAPGWTIFKNALVPLSGHAVAAVAAFWADRLTGELPAITSLMISFVAMVAVVGALIVLWPQFRAGVAPIRKVMISMTRRKKPRLK